MNLNTIKKGINEYKGLLFLIVVLLTILVFPVVHHASKSTSNSTSKSYIENYSNYNLANPREILVEEEPLLQDTYETTHNKNVTANNIRDIWWQYPIFNVGSYAQITNNLRYRKNPDDGECRTSEFCNAMYYDNEHVKSNLVDPLPPAPLIDESKVRINYYTTDSNLFLGPQAGPDLQAFQ